MENLQYVGKSVPRVDAKVKVTGEARYTVDVSFPNMLWGRLLRSPLAHARILHIDTSRAEKVPGVKAVITGKDTPFTYGVSHMDQKPLHMNKVRHVGNAIAAVAAVDEETAQEAVELIRVDYEELPAVFHPLDAMAPGAPVIHEGVEGNVAARPSFENGDVEKAFAESDYVFEDTFETPPLAHVCPEPHVCVAKWDHSGKLTFYVSSQMPSLARTHFANFLKMPESRIRVITNYVGGGFGSKTLSRFPIEFASVVLARKTGRPVKFQHTREEEFHYSTLQFRFVVTVKTGINKDGTITGRHFKAICECGGYVSHGASITAVAGALQGVLYRYQNYKYDGYAVYTNVPYGGAFRGIGNPQVHFAGEAQLNKIASEIGVDPLELRLKNATRAGDRSATGALVRSCGLSECLEKVAEEIKWKEKRGNPKPNHGLGIACGVHFTGIRLPTMPDTDFAEAKIMVNDDGSVNLTTSCVDLGQGSTTVLTQIAAEVLGIDIDRIHTIYGDTETCPMEWGTRASRVTAIGGMAVKNVAEDARDQILRAAGDKLEINPEDLELKDNRVQVKGNPSVHISISEVARFNRFRKNGQAIMATNHWDAPSHGNISSTFSFGAKAIEMEVDSGTGRTRVLRVVAANDLGRAINPAAACGQIEGGVHMGLGMASSEEIVINEKGEMVNNQFLDYRVLTPLDMPPVTPIFVETHDPIGAFGAKGLGEMAMIGTAEAFVSAVHAAAGIWIQKLPVTPEKVLLAMKKKK